MLIQSVQCTTILNVIIRQSYSIDIQCPNGGTQYYTTMYYAINTITAINWLHYTILCCTITLSNSIKMIIYKIKYSLRLCTTSSNFL